MVTSTCSKVNETEFCSQLPLRQWVYLKQKSDKGSPSVAAGSGNTELYLTEVDVKPN